MDPAQHDRFQALVREQLELLGEDATREGLERTPLRVAKSLEFLTSGYPRKLSDVLNQAVFEERCDEMVIVTDIELYSLCEHHMLPFFGKAHVAYLPDGKILGLSKVPRIVDMFARRLQVQERLTTEVAQAIDDAISPRGVAVVIEARHFCMMMRGVQKQNSSTTTSCMLGHFKSDSKTRTEFLNLLALRMRGGY